MGATPPQFNPPRQQSSNKIWLWLLIAVGVFCVLCAIGGYFMFKSAMNIGSTMISCSLNGDLARDAVLAYALDHGGKLPPAATWQDDVRPYYQRLYEKVMSDQGLKDVEGLLDINVSAPGTPLECEMGGGKKTGFSYNSLVAGKLTTDFPDPASTVLIFEVPNPAYNASGDPALRTGPSPTIMGDNRPWIDFYISGQNDPMKSSNNDFDYDSRPEDGLPPAKPGTTTGTPNQAGS